MAVARDIPTTERLNRRQEERFSSHAPIIFSLFSTRSHREYASMTFNHSRNGMCLETAEALMTGTTLYIRRADKFVDEHYEANWKYLRTFSLAQVRWCRELRDKFGTYYCIGAKYF